MEESMNRTLIPTLFNDEAIAFRPVYAVLNELKSLAGQETRSALADVSVYEDEASFVVEAPVPGVKPEDIKVDLKEGVLYIQAERKEEKKEMKCHCKTTSRFSYSVALPQPVDEKGEIKAQTKEGILTVALPKTQAARPVKITVKHA